MNTYPKCVPSSASSPGWLVWEEAKFLGLTKSGLARRLGVSLQALYQIISGKIALSPTLAQKLEYVLNVPADVWNNLEKGYRHELVRLYEVGEKEIAWLKEQPVEELKALGLIQGQDEKELFRSLMAFYKVGGLKGFNSVFKKACGDSRRAPSVRCLEILTAETKISSYQRSKLKKVLEEIRYAKSDALLLDCLGKAIKRLAKAGVAMAVYKGPSREVLGATKWLSRNKALVGISPEGKNPYETMEMLYHESCHVLEQRRLVSYLSCKEKQTKNAVEEKAARFAYEMLLTSKADPEVRVCQKKSDLLILAEKYRVPLFVVAGRYGVLTGDRKKFQRLCPLFKWPKGVWHL